MTALTQDRLTRRRDGELVSDPIAAATTLYAGGMYALDASGYAVPAGTAGAGAARAVCQAHADNSAGAAADIAVEGRRGVHLFANSAGGDAIGHADIGAQCYVVDDQTVALTAAGGSRRRAGRIVDVDSAGVWVDVGNAMTEPSIQTVDVVLDRTAVQNLNATPRTLVAAPGSGLALVLVDVQVRKPAGTAYAGIAAGEDLSIKYTDASGTEVCQIETTGFLDQTTDQTRFAYATTAAAIAPVANAPLVAHMLVGEITTGDSSLTFRVRYRTIALAI